jgi:hypothetical protein
MGIVDDKRSIFNEIGAFNSIKDDLNLPDVNNSLPSINNSKEIVPFLLDMLTVLVGSEVLKYTTGEVMTDFIRNVEGDLKTELKKQYSTFNSDQSLPTTFTTTGYDLDMSNVDIFEKLKTDPNTQLGSLLYSNDANSFDNVLYNSLVNAGSPQNFANTVNLTYNDTLNTVTVTAHPSIASDTIGEFTTQYIDSLEIINEKQFVSDISNVIFGTVTTNQNKTEQQAILEEKVNKTIKKIIDEEESIAITNDELRDIEQIAKQRIDGVTYADLGCGQLPNIVTLDCLEALVTGTTGNSDPLTVGNAYLNTLTGGFEDTNPEKAEENQETIKDGFFKRLINAIVEVLVSALVLPPQIRVLNAMFSGFKNNNNPELSNPLNDLQNQRVLANCLAKRAKSLINEFLFNLVKKELLKLVIPVTKKILREKINQYVALLRSLLGQVSDFI